MRLFLLLSLLATSAQAVTWVAIKKEGTKVIERHVVVAESIDASKYSGYTIVKEGAPGDELPPVEPTLQEKWDAVKAGAPAWAKVLAEGMGLK
jgi:hypothetical protein